ncbi:MAG: phage replisome organizer N-terminal domain-containing protein [Clostridiaceae bacterium]|nr:phage replisome organizer N-terminal domain-containing protein [Clostridiaceae bacterium]
MCDVKWVKVMVDMFENKKFRFIDALPHRDVINYVWIRLLCETAKINDGGKLYFMEDEPYTNEMLATLFSRPLECIDEAIRVLSKYKMIERDEDGVLRITNWETYQNVEGLDKIKQQTRKRVSKFRNKHKDEVIADKDSNKDEISNNESSDNIISLNNKETEKEMDKPQSETISKNNSNVTNLKCNVTDASCNVTVTQQNKNKKEEEEKEKKREIRENASENENGSCEKAAKVLSHYEKITGKAGILNFNALSLALGLYEEKHVRAAIDEAIGANKLNMRYINGILKNWAANGFKEGEVGNGRREPICKDNREFEGVKPTKARELTKAERDCAERELI